MCALHRWFYLPSFPWIRTDPTWSLTECLSDVIFSMQKNLRSKIVNFNPLKAYQGTDLPTWLKKPPRSERKDCAKQTGSLTVTESSKFWKIYCFVSVSVANILVNLCYMWFYFIRFLAYDSHSSLRLRWGVPVPHCNHRFKDKGRLMQHVSDRHGEKIAIVVLTVTTLPIESLASGGRHGKIRKDGADRELVTDPPCWRQREWEQWEIRTSTP